MLSKSKRHFQKIIILSAVILASCGGGTGTGTNDISGGVSAVQASSVLTPSFISEPIAAGKTFPLSAHVVMKGVEPTSMKWTVYAIDTPNINDPVPVISDPNCSGASFSKAISAETTGEGFCSVIISVPVNSKTGKWRFTNVATNSQIGSVSRYIDVSITEINSSGFKLIESSVPVTSYQSKLLSLNIPYTASAGATISDVKYKWTQVTGNPTTSVIIGENNSNASVIPSGSGIYTFNAEVTATVNGRTEKVTGSVIAQIYPVSKLDIISAGDLQIVMINDLVKLKGSILNKDNTFQYSTQWQQLSGNMSGPVSINLSNEKTDEATFMAKVAGTYGFEYVVTKNELDGTKTRTTAQTSVIVQDKATPIFTASAGDAQIVDVNSIVTLKGLVSAQQAQTGVTYKYLWTQVGTTPSVIDITNQTSSTATFIPLKSGVYLFDFTVLAITPEGVITTTGRTQVTVKGQSQSTFTASAGPAQMVVVKSGIVTLSGSVTNQGSNNDANYRYTWTQIGNTPSIASISNSNNNIATFFPSDVGTYTFNLNVDVTTSTGTISTSSTTQVVVIAAPVNP